MPVNATLTQQPAGSRPPERILIIGGGVAGLACGCYLQMNGFDTEILEAGAALGGLCAAWDRGSYIFDGCLRWLVGARPGTVFHEIWTELGVTPNARIVHHDYVVRIEGQNGEVLLVPADPERLAEEFKKVAPEDTLLIERLAQDAQRCASLEPFKRPLELMGPLERLKTGLHYLRFAPTITRWKGLRVTEYVARYRNPFLRAALMAMAGDERSSALVLVMPVALRAGSNTGMIVGGSRAFAGALTDRYRDLGGSTRVNTRVVSVRVENGRANGVRCDTGEAIPGAAVVSCSDGYATIFKMLEGRYVTRTILTTYQKCPVFPALIQVSLGIGRALPGAPHTLILQLRSPLIVDEGTRHDWLELTIFDSSLGLCPEGKAVITARFAADFKFWTALRDANPSRYYQEKERVLRDVLRILDARFPGLPGWVETDDVATPPTFVRYTGNWQGSYEGWLPSPQILGKKLPFTLPGLRDFYMAGHWVMPGGGIPSAAISGRYVAQLISARAGREFRTAP